MRSGSSLATWYIDYAPCDGQFDEKGRFGLSGDIPLSGDFNVDGVDDICVYRPSSGTWYVCFADISGYPEFESHLAINGVLFGTSGDIPFAGDIWFVNVNGDDVINDFDRTVIGNPQPDFIFGFNNQFGYKNFDLSIFFQGSYGNDIWNGVRVSHEGMESTYNQFTSTLNRWNGEGSSNTMPRAIYADPNRNNRASTRWVEDGSYLRLKNLTFGYRFTQDWLTNCAIS
jgi:hypothetical protein